MKKIKLPKIKKPALSPKQKKVLTIVVGIVAILGIAGLTVRHNIQKKADAAYVLADQILGSEVEQGNPYIATEYPVFEKNFKEMADKKYLGDAMIILVDEFTEVSQNNALYYDEQEKKAAEQNSADENGEKDEQDKKDKKKKKKEKKKEEKEALQLMQDSQGREHDFEQTAPALSKAVSVLTKMDYINGDLYNSFANFYNTYSTYILDKYSNVPAEEKNAAYKYEFATKMRSLVKEVDAFNANAGEFYHLENSIVCTPAQVKSLYEQAVQMGIAEKDGTTLANVLRDIQSFPSMKENIASISGEILRMYTEDAQELATLQNGVGGYYDDPNHRGELAAMSNIPYDENGIHGDFYYVQNSYVAYRGNPLVEQQIDKPIQYQMNYALRMPEGNFVFIGKDQLQLSSDPEAPFIQGDFSNIVNQLAEFYANGGIPKPVVPEPIPVKEPEKEPDSTEENQQEQKKEDVKNIKATGQKYRGEVVGKLDSPHD